MPEARLKRARATLPADYVYKPGESKPATTAPHPGRNLGVHLKAPVEGEYVTEHHRGAKKR